MPLKKQYILKPGRHQFVPGEHAMHYNGNLSDEQAVWYLAKYPHIRPLFKKIPSQTDAAVQPAETAANVNL